MSGTNGTAAYSTRTYGDFSASSSARASARGLVSKSCGLGRRFTARGSTRPGRLPMIWAGMFARAASIKLAATESSLKTMTNQLAVRRRKAG